MKKFYKYLSIFTALFVVPAMITFYAATDDKNFFYLIVAYVCVVFFITLLLFGLFFFAEFPEEMIRDARAEHLAHPHAINFWYVIMSLTTIALFFYVNSIIGGMYFVTCVLLTFMRHRLMIEK